MDLRTLFSQDKFLFGVELVTTRGMVLQESSQKAVSFGEDLAAAEKVDWISITDNAGGNPALSADFLGGGLREKNTEVLIHLSAKDMNRNGIENRLWTLASRGLTNVLVLSGDYPVAGYQGISRPVFDVDSVCMLHMLREMNQGLRVPGRKKGASILLDKTGFFCGACVSPFKKLPSELAGQYLKMGRKIREGASFLITQVGYDARKWDELKHYIEQKQLSIPLIGYVYLLNRGVARVFHRGMIPGCVVSDALLEKVEHYAGGPDRGKAFCREFAAKQIAILKGMGYRGAYLGGVTNRETVDAIHEQAGRFGPDDWKEFAKELQFPQDNEFYLYPKDPATALTFRGQSPVETEAKKAAPVPAFKRKAGASQEPFALFERAGFLFNDLVHAWFFEPGRRFFSIMRWWYRLLDKHPAAGKFSYFFERIIKRILFSCNECGDCSLPDINYLCPESKCKKRQRNGPCGGSFQGTCEANESTCIWVRAYRRCRSDQAFAALFDKPPVFVDDRLNSTSSWANNFLGRDHHRSPADSPEKTESPSS